MKPPRIHDPGPHVRVGRELRPRPPSSGVAELLEQRRGQTRVAYGCAEGRVLVTFDWALTELEFEEADAAACPRAGAPVEQVLEALAHVFGRSITYQLATEVEVHPVERLELRGNREAAE